MKLDDLRVMVSLFTDDSPTPIARALGLDIDLPNPNSGDPAYWKEVHRVGWKPQLRGKIHDTEEATGDPDWCTLMVLNFCEVRFDLEEGIKFNTRVATRLPTLDLVHGLVSRGLVPLDDDGDPQVWVMQSRFGHKIPDPGATFRAAGLKQKNPAEIFWVMDLDRWPIPTHP